MIALAIFSLLLLTVIVIVIMIKEKWNTLIVVILIPFLLFNFAFSWHTIGEIWGQPRDGLPEDSFRIVYSKNAKPWIFLLTMEPDVDYPVFRKIAWSEQTEKELEKGTKAQKEGKKMIARKKQNPQNETDTQIELYEWNAQTAMPKD